MVRQLVRQAGGERGSEHDPVADRPTGFAPDDNRTLARRGIEIARLEGLDPGRAATERDLLALDPRQAADRRAAATAARAEERPLGFDGGASGRVVEA